MQFIKKVQLLYGKTWSSFYGGKLGEASSLKQFSSSSEMPRLEIIDPEGMALRRLYASAKILELKQIHANRTGARMNLDVTTSFLTYYIRSLAERTRVEKTSTKYGFDWVIYNLALADNMTPYRLPFLSEAGQLRFGKLRQNPNSELICHFLSPDRTDSTIFVLKDEVLSNANWTANGFDSDLRRAAAPNLAPPEFKNIRIFRRTNERSHAN